MGYRSQTQNGIPVQSGGVVTVNVSLSPDSGPSIRITSPPSGTAITTATALVRGEVSAPARGASGVSVNGVPGVMDAGQFAALVPVDSTVASLTATLSDLSGMIASDTVAVTVPGGSAETPMRLQAHPPGGPGPLTVAFSLSSAEAISQLALNADAPGVPEFQGTTLDGMTVTYVQPRLYVPTVRVVDAQGQMRTAATLVHVFDRGALDAQIQDTWSGFKNALRAGDLARAGSFLHSDTRATYLAQLSNLSPAALAGIDQIMTTIELIDVGFGGVQYEMLRQGPDQLLSFAVWFQIDQDGLWRLRKF